MMKISRKVEYALRAIIFLTRQSSDKVRMISVIAQATGVSHGFMAKILKELSFHGFVKSQKGPHGGYKLHLNPENISFKDVIEAIEGPLEINECVPDHSLCNRVGECEMYAVWCEAYNAVNSVFAKTTMSSVVKGFSPDIFESIQLR